MLESGQELSARFVLVRALGAGGSGSVWLAQDKELGRFVAVKVLSDELMQDAAAVAALGYRLALVGTTLMKHTDVARATAQLVEAGRGATKRRSDVDAGQRGRADA